MDASLELISRCVAVTLSLRIKEGTAARALGGGRRLSREPPSEFALPSSAATVR